MEDSDDTLRWLVIHDDAYLESVLARGFADSSASGLDSKTQALARVAALVGAGAEPAVYMCAVETGLAAGATREEFVGVLVALVPTIGPDRVVSAAPKLGLALGYDVEEALERRD